MGHDLPVEAGRSRPRLGQPQLPWHGRARPQSGGRDIAAGADARTRPSRPPAPRAGVRQRRRTRGLAPAVVPEAPLERTDGGTVPAGSGWFVLNTREAKWLDGTFGAYTRFEGRADAHFPQVGINIGVLAPGQPSCMYHGEDAQEDFLVLQGECLLLIEGEERPLRAWDFVHCPAWTEHVFVGAGDGPCTLLAIGARPSEARPSDDVVYPASEVAQRHRAGVEQETRDADVAYEGVPDDEPVGYRQGWLPAD
jgi:uncharacterized cupin superfamily protein